MKVRCITVLSLSTSTVRACPITDRPQSQMHAAMRHCFEAAQHTLDPRPGFFDLLGFDFMVWRRPCITLTLTPPGRHGAARAAHRDQRQSSPPHSLQGTIVDNIMPVTLFRCFVMSSRVWSALPFTWCSRSTTRLRLRTLRRPHVPQIARRAPIAPIAAQGGFEVLYIDA